MAPKKQASKEGPSTSAKDTREQAGDKRKEKEKVVAEEKKDNKGKETASPSAKPTTGGGSAAKKQSPAAPAAAAKAPSGVSWPASLAALLVAIFVFAYIKKDEWQAVIAQVSSGSSPSPSASHAFAPEKVASHPLFEDLSTPPLLPKESLKVAVSVPFPLVTLPLSPISICEICIHTLLISSFFSIAVIVRAMWLCQRQAGSSLPSIPLLSLMSRWQSGTRTSRALPPTQTTVFSSPRSRVDLPRCSLSGLMPKIASGRWTTRTMERASPASMPLT